MMHTTFLIILFNQALTKQYVAEFEATLLATTVANSKSLMG
jgi:hypothetical protein